MEEGRILIADDEERMRTLVRDFLGKKGYTVLEAANGQEALRIFETDEKLDLIILDVMMPVMDGYTALRKIRETSKIPVIMLTAKSAEQDELQGFELGVDEYITKPFSLKILLARIGALLRRSTPDEKQEVLKYQGIVLDKTAHQVMIDGKPLELSYKEFELLVYFMENTGVALSRERILNAVWNYDYYGDARTIDTHVKKLRSKLGDSGDLIKTVWGIGYKMGD